MCRNDQQYQFAPSPRAPAAAIANAEHKILKTVVFVLASAIVVLWMAYLMEVALTKPNFVTQHLTLSETVDRSHKGDRLTIVNFDDKGNNLLEQINKPLSERRAERIPVGCEPAFSTLVKVGNFSRRCLS
jgi:hypothetical protein